MLKLYLGKAHVICWIVIGSLVQAQEFSTTVVKEGEDAIIECGLQTKVEEGYLRWETMTNGSPVDLAYDIRDGKSNCNDGIINCTLYANGSIQLESVSKEDGARYYRCLRGDDNGYDYYSDHRLSVLSKESPSISQSPTSAIAFKASRKGIVHSYGEQVCEDDVDGNLPVVCYPPSGIIVDREYETIQCNCTDSDGLMDSVTFPVTKQMSSSPSIETPHRESVSSYNIGKKGVLHGYNAPVCEDDVDGNLPVVCYPPSGVIVERGYETIQCNCTDSDGLMDNVTFPVSRQMSSPPIETPHRESVSSYDMGKKGVLHGYNAPVCEDDVDGNLPVVCYPPSGIIVDREYETIQCNCTDSDGLMDSVTFPVTSVTHWVHPGWKKAFISILVISIPIILVLILICCYLYLKRKKSKAYHTAAKPEEMTLIGTKDKQISDLEEKIATLEATLNNRQTELTQRNEEVSSLTVQLEQKEKQETEMKNKLEEQNQKINTIQTELTEREREVSNLKEQLEQKETQETEMKNKLEEQNQKINTIQTELTEREREVSNLKEQLEQKDTQETEMKNKLAEQNEKINTIQTELTEREREVSNLKEQLEQKDTQETEMKNKLEEQNENINNSQTELTARDEELSNLKEQLEQKKTQETEMKNKLEEQNEKISKIEKELAVKEADNNGLEKRLEDRQQQISSLEKILADDRAFLQQQQDTASKQDGKKYQEDDNNSEFDKNSSPSEKETKEEGTPRKGKKRDPERRTTLKGLPQMSPEDTPSKNSQSDQDVGQDSNKSYTTEDKKDLDKDETDFSKSKGCSDDTGPNVSRAFKEYLIDDDSECKGFNLAFMCDGTDMRIELRINEGIDGSICQFEFKNGEIIPSYRGKPEKAIGFKQGTQYDLNLGNHKRVLSLFQRNSAQGNECVKKFEQYDFVLIRLLCIYTSDTSSVSILSHLGLTELPTPVDDLN
ncbi:uncharacterized protein [Apostichopus japonicus]|uniref:uncharacterized protein isoform X3 n=1 Tax=Stichopus japonicus TaxID=307972 RepID=UPI003AB8E79D